MNTNDFELTINNTFNGTVYVTIGMSYAITPDEVEFLHTIKRSGVQYYYRNPRDEHEVKCLDNLAHYGFLERCVEPEGTIFSLTKMGRAFLNRVPEDYNSLVCK